MKATVGDRRFTRFTAVVAIAAIGSSVHAGISSTVFSIRAENTSGSSTFVVDFSEGNWNASAGVYTWSLGGAIDLTDDTNSSVVVAGLQSASLSIQTGLSPSISLNLGVVAGASNTSFYVDTAQVDFSTIPAATAEASFQANAHIWDNQLDGAYMVGLGDPGVGAFRSVYNGVYPTGSVFSHLLSVIMVGTGGGDAGAGEAYPQSGTIPVGTDVNDISVYAAFVVSGGDRLVGGGSFGVTPEPGGLALLAVGAALVLPWRRR